MENCETSPTDAEPISSLEHFLAALAVRVVLAKKKGGIDGERKSTAGD
jgi:hypothetical protein